MSSLESSEEFSNLRHLLAKFELQREAEKLASLLWEKLVAKVGKSTAKNIMRRVMGDNKLGRPETAETEALMFFIYAHVLNFGRHQSHREIARRIFESKPHYVQCESGAIGIASSGLTAVGARPEKEEDLAKDDPVVRQWPLKMGLAAIQKRVERVRKRALNEDLLPKEYAPKLYRHD